MKRKTLNRNGNILLDYFDDNAHKLIKLAHFIDFYFLLEFKKSVVWLNNHHHQLYLGKFAFNWIFSDFVFF